jgi:glyoxylase-like metal-dependent hydrolase (beta-lactamase superfamily II)
MPELHEAGLPFFENVHQQARNYGFQMEPCRGEPQHIAHGDSIAFGNSALKAVYTPGHADGSLCFIADADRFVVTGDVLFKDSIGRTDFPTGDFDVLMNSIHNELFVLDEDFKVYCGHGPETSIGYEKVNNPFIRF